MFAVIKKTFPSGEGGTRSVTDEEIEVCTAETTEADIIQ